jgi:hypothetical protein
VWCDAASILLARVELEDGGAGGGDDNEHLGTGEGLLV